MKKIIYLSINNNTIIKHSHKTFKIKKSVMRSIMTASFPKFNNNNKLIKINIKKSIMLISKQAMIIIINQFKTKKVQSKKKIDRQIN